MKAAVKMRY